MSEKQQDRTPKRSFYTWGGVVIGAVLALFFAKSGNPGLIGVGAVIGMTIGAELDRRSGRQIT